MDNFLTLRYFNDTVPVIYTLVNSGDKMQSRLAILFLFVSLCASTAVMAADCKPDQMSSRVLNIVKPFLSESIITRTEKSKGWDEHKKRKYDLLDKIIEDTSNAGDETIAYLLHLYNGEHPDEELSCEAIIRGKRMLPLLQRYSACLPKTGLEPLPKSFESTGELLKEVIETIEKGETCQHHE